MNIPDAYHHTEEHGFHHNFLHFYCHLRGTARGQIWCKPCFRVYTRAGKFPGFFYREPHTMEVGFGKWYDFFFAESFRHVFQSWPVYCEACRAKCQRQRFCYPATIHFCFCLARSRIFFSGNHGLLPPKYFFH